MSTAVKGRESIVGPRNFDVLAGKIQSKLLTTQAIEKNGEKLQHLQVPLQFIPPSKDGIPVRTSVPPEQLCQTKLRQTSQSFHFLCCQSCIRRSSPSCYIFVGGDSTTKDCLNREAKNMIDTIAKNKEVDCLPLRVLADSFFHQAKRLGPAKRMALEVQEKYLGVWLRPV